MLELLPRKTIIKAYVGAMFSKKTEKMIADVKELELSTVFEFQAFKPALDKRYGESRISTRYGMQGDEPILWIPATAISAEHPEEMIGLLNPNTKVVVADEVQFFDDEIIDVFLHLKSRGISVLCASLDLNFRGEPYGPAPSLLAYADLVVKGESYCHFVKPDGHRCGNIGNRTQRLLFGKPAPYSDPIQYVEDPANKERTYQLRCEEHHIVPGKPSPLERLVAKRAA